MIDKKNNLLWNALMLIIILVGVIVSFTYSIIYIVIFLVGIVIYSGKFKRLKFGRNMFLILFVLFIVLALVDSVSAIGITPGRTTFNYEPGVSKTVSINIVNSEARDMDIVVLVQGELNQSLSVSEVSFKISASESSKIIEYTITMPTGLSPGTRKGEVVVIQLPDKSGNSQAFVGSALGVATQVFVNVPYPGKFAEAGLNVVGPNEKGELIFVIPVVSKGELELVRVRGTVDIYSSLNERLDTLGTNEVSISSNQRKEITATWDVKGIQPGVYRAVVSVLYDEKVTTVEKQFSVGEQILDLQQIEVNDFSLGEIAKFEFLVENKWSNVIEGAYAQMYVYNNAGEVMADFKSATYDILPLEKSLMVSFWDTAGVGRGSYDAEVFLRYGQQSTQENLRLEISSNEINVVGLGYVISSEGRGGSVFGGNSLVIILITAIVVLILINVLWFLVLRKKLKK